MPHNYKTSLQGAAIRATKQNQEMKDTIQSAQYEIQNIHEYLDAMDYPVGESSISIETVRAFMRDLKNILDS